MTKPLASTAPKFRTFPLIAFAGALGALTLLSGCGDDQKDKLQTACVALTQKEADFRGAPQDVCACVVESLAKVRGDKGLEPFVITMEALASGEDLGPVTSPSAVNDWLLLAQATEHCGAALSREPSMGAPD